ncbi:MAG: hypothetical protein H0W15_11745 [Gemmatimonadales bacterium]|nr:hypothetical protein [Gemmatimonadales bacterium]
MIALGAVVIIGGGCYGAFYAAQLQRARNDGTVTYERLLVVDRDPACQVATQDPAPDRDVVVAEWDDFLDRWLDPDVRRTGDRPDMIVPSPLMPHLMANWIMRRARDRWPEREVRTVPAAVPLGTPFDMLHGDGTRYVSFADWLCPTHCIEPGLCPATRAPRTWEMGEAVEAWTHARGTERPTAGPALFTCRHVAYGVGMYPAARAFEGFDALVAQVEATGSADLVVGSVSACHGAIGLIRVAEQGVASAVEAR